MAEPEESPETMQTTEDAVEPSETVNETGQPEESEEAPPAAEAEAAAEETTQAENTEAEAAPDVEKPAEDTGEEASATDEAGAGEAPAEAKPDGEEAADGEATAKEGDNEDGEDGKAGAASADGEYGDQAAAEGVEATEGEGEEDAAAVGQAEGGEAAATTTEGEGVEGEGAAAEAPAAGEGEGEGAAAAGEAAAAEGEEGAPTKGEGEEEAATGEDEGEAGEEGQQKPAAPTSEEFAEGERAESPLPRASEKLSRDATPTGDHPLTDRIDEVDEEAERPEPTSPDAVVATFDELGLEVEGEEEEEEEEEEYEEEEVEEEEFNREHMIASYNQALKEREQKIHQNSLLQTKLSDYFRRKKADQGGQEAGQEADKSITDQEQRYAKFVFNLDELRRTRDAKRDEYEDRIQDLELECQSREEEVRLVFQGLLDAKRRVGLKAVSATNGRPFPAATQKRSDEAAGGGKAQDLLSTSVDDMLQEEAALEDQVVRVRLDNIGLSNRVHKCETSLKAKEELSEGLHMIDFEQLKIENQTYNEKIEERQEELLKLKKKITNNVQVLTHLKEKLQFVQCKRQEQCEGLDELDQTLAKRRDQLTRTKQARDSLRNDNQRLKQNSGLLGNEALLRNFEDNVDLVTEKRDRLEKLKMQHSEMTLQCSKLKRKIDVARAQSAQ